MDAKTLINDLQKLVLDYGNIPVYIQDRTADLGETESAKIKFRQEEEALSECCGAPAKFADICQACGEHAEFPQVPDRIYIGG